MKNVVGQIVAAALFLQALLREHVSLRPYRQGLVEQLGAARDLGIRTIAPHMIAQKSGSIVNISSVDGLRGVNALAAYVSSKWGVRGLTKVAALELGHQGVRVNSIHPGGVNTAMSNPTGAPLEEINKHYANVPQQRVGLPEEIARATLFLASDEASYCNGAELAVDGGMAAGAYYPGLPGAPF